MMLPLGPPLRSADRRPLERHDRGGRRGASRAGELEGLTFFEATAEGAEAQAKAYLALSEPQN